MIRRPLHGLTSALILAFVLSVALNAAQTSASLTIRGKVQTLHLYGPPGGDPVIVASGDGGWIHLGPSVAELLGAHGYFVVGFDAKAYLEDFTTSRSTLQPADEPGDFAQLAAFASRASGKKTLLIGVSEGAGLAVLAATDAATRARLAGVIGLGLPDLNELGWRWKDAMIYLTHGTPKEPMFSAAAIVGSLAPLPLAAVHSTHDEFVPVTEVQRVMAAAREPKRLWMIDAADHRFSDKPKDLERNLLDAIVWVRQNAIP